VVASLLLLLAPAACTEPIEGCLDIEASNYQVDADNPCADCCIYPRLRLVFRHKQFVSPDTTINFSYDSLYTDGAGNVFRIQDIRYYLQGASLIRPDGELTRTDDTVRLFFREPAGDTSSQVVEDHFFRMEADNFSSFSMGTFRYSGTFSGFRLFIGLEGSYADLIPELSPEDHPLADTSLFVADTGFVLCRLEILPDTTAADTIPRIIRLFAPQPLHVLEENIPLEVPQGFGPVYSVQVNYAEWFDGVNVRQDPTEKIAQQIGQNLKNSFSVVETRIE
jgi:hypothetical protein